MNMVSSTTWYLWPQGIKKHSCVVIGIWWYFSLFVSLHHYLPVLSREAVDSFFFLPFHLIHDKSKEVLLSISIAAILYRRSHGIPLRFESIVPQAFVFLPLEPVEQGRGGVPAVNIEHVCLPTPSGRRPPYAKQVPLPYLDRCRIERDMCSRNVGPVDKLSL